MATTYTLQNNKLPTKVSFVPGPLRPEDLNRAQDLGLINTSNAVSALFNPGIVSTTDPTLNIGALSVSFPNGVQAVQISSGSAIFSDGVQYNQPNTEVISLIQTSGVTNYILTLAKNETALTTRYNPIKDKLETADLGWEFSIELLSRTEYDALTTQESENHIFLAELVPSDTGFAILSLSERPWFTTPDIEHRSKRGSGLVSTGNPHGMSMSDLTPLPGMSFWEQSNLLGTISNVQSGFNRGDLVTQTITPEQLTNNLYPHSSCRVATTTNLTATYSNGFSGIGALLTSTVNGALQIDGITLAVNDRILVKDQSDKSQNGVYSVTVIGTTGTPWILTRAIDFNADGNVNYGDLISVTEGTLNYGKIFETKIPKNNLTIGTDDITFTSYSGFTTSGVSFRLDRGSAYVLSVVNDESGENINFTYNRGTRTVTCYPNYVITSNLTVRSILINLGTVIQKSGSGSILEVTPGLLGEYLVSSEGTVSSLSTTELNVQGLAGAVYQYIVYATPSGEVKINPTPVVQTNLFNIQNGVTGTIYLPSNNFVNIAITNFIVPQTFTLELEVTGSGGTQLIKIADPETAANDTSFGTFTVPYGTDLTTSGTEIFGYTDPNITQWVKTANTHSYISSISVVAATNLPTTLGFLVTQDSLDSEAINLASVKLTNKGNVFEIIDLREQKIFTEQPRESIFYEDFYNPINFNPTLSSSTLNPGLRKSTWYSRPLKLDSGVYRVLVNMSSVDVLPYVGYSIDFGNNIITLEDTGIYAGFNTKVYTLSLTETKFVSLYLSTVTSGETKVQSISLDMMQTPVNVQFGMPTGVYEGFTPVVNNSTRVVTLNIDSDSGRSLASLSYPSGTFYYQRNTAWTVTLDSRNTYNRIDLIAIKYKDADTIPSLVVIKGQSSDPTNAEPTLVGSSVYDSAFKYLILAKAFVPKSTVTTPITIRTYGGNQGTGRNYRMSYFLSIAQEIENARNNFPNLSQQIKSLNDTVISNARSGLISFTVAGSTSNTETKVSSYTIKYSSGSTIEYDSDTESFKLNTPGFYEVIAVSTADALFSPNNTGQLTLRINYTSTTYPSGTTQILDSSVDLFGGSNYAMVKVEPDWSNVRVYFDRLANYTSIIRGSIKFIEPLPSMINPNIDNSLDGIPVLYDLQLNGVSANAVTVAANSSVAVSSKFAGITTLIGPLYRGIMSYETPVIITPSSVGTTTYTLSITNGGRTVTSTFTITTTS